MPLVQKRNTKLEPSFSQYLCYGTRKSRTHGAAGTYPNRNLFRLLADGEHTAVRGDDLAAGAGLSGSSRRRQKGDYADTQKELTAVQKDAAALKADAR
jgi:hypothetical protein